MNSPVFDRVGGSSTNPSPSGSFPTNHFGVALGVRARDAMALATMSVAARVFVSCAARRLAWCGVVVFERLLEASCSSSRACTSIYVYIYEPCVRLKLPKSTNAITRGVQSLHCGQGGAP